MKTNDIWRMLEIKFFLVWIAVLWEMIWLAKSEKNECWGLYLNIQIANVLREYFVTTAKYVCKEELVVKLNKTVHSETLFSSKV